MLVDSRNVGSAATYAYSYGNNSKDGVKRLAF